MQVRATILVVLLGLGLGGCVEERAHRFARAPAFYVPTAAIVQRPATPGLATAAQVLPESDEAYYFPRGEKGVDGNISVYESSSIAVLTYDVQRIASRGEGSGYRYRWGVQQAFTIP